MRSSVLRAHRGRSIFRALAMLLLATGIALAVGACSGPQYERRGALHCVVDGDSLYTFDPVWRLESLRAVDPATGMEALDGTPSPDPERLHRLRAVLLRELRVATLEAVPSEGMAEMKALRALGYL